VKSVRFEQIYNFIRRIFKNTYINFYEDPSIVEAQLIHAGADRHTDVTDIAATFTRNFAKRA
jgi:hypothetical protein